MRLVITFFVFVWFHLLGDCNAVLGSIHHGKVFPILHGYLSAVKTAAPAAQNQRHFLQNDTNLPDENGFLLFTEEDNEEENTRKLKSPTEPVSIFFCSLIVSHPCIALTSNASFYRHKSYPGDCKYLAFRVLRI